MNLQILLFLTLSLTSSVKIESLRISVNKAVLNTPIVNSIKVFPPARFYMKGDTIILDVPDTNAQYLIVYQSLRVRVPPLFDTTGSITPTQVEQISGNVGREFTLPTIDLSGIKTVGMLGGTNQSATLNQILDLRIQGKFTGYQVEGIINDQNLSYQGAERLRNIDKVYLRVTGKKLSVRIGDLEPQNINQNLRLRGINFGYNLNDRSNVGFTYGIEDGTPITFEFHPQPGKLGPYFLDPAGRPVQIVPGSERVFLNGILLKRGINQDYTIDELVGTITFNPKWTFTESDVIRVEYQKQAGFPVTEYIETKANLRDVLLSVFQEGANTELLKRIMSPSQIEFLKSLGDTVGFVWVDGGHFVGAGNGNYELRDSIYEYVGEFSGSYIVHFEYLGTGNGDYIYDPQLGAFRFVGKNLGDYNPVEKIEVPDRKRYALLQWKTRRSKRVSINLNLQALQHNRNAFVKTTPRNSGSGDVKVTFNPASNFSVGIYSYFKSKQFILLNREKFPVGFSNLYGIPPNNRKSRVQINEIETTWKPYTSITLKSVVGTAELNGEYKKRTSGTFLVDNENSELEIKLDRVYGAGSQMMRASVSTGIFKNLPLYPVITFWREQTDTSKNTYYGSGLVSKKFRLNLKYYLERRLTILTSTGSIRLGLLKLDQQTQISKVYSLPFNYALNLNWRLLNLSGSHLITNGSLAERQITYRYVGPGQGDYSYDQERKEYIPDPNGDFIRVDVYSGSYTSGRVQSHSLNYFGKVQNTTLGISMNARFQGKKQSYYQSTMNIAVPGKLSPRINLDFVYRLTSGWKEVLSTGGVSLMLITGTPSVSTELKAKYHESFQQFVLRKLENIWEVTWVGRVVWQLLSEIGYALSGDLRAITIGTGSKTRSQNLLGFYFDSYFKVRYTSVTGSIPPALGFLIEPGPSLNASIGVGKPVGTSINLSAYLTWWFSQVRKDLFFNISASTRF